MTLGHSGVKVTRLAFGTGTIGGKVQRELGQEEFTRLVRHAYERGIRFFETAESYTGMPEMLSIALKGIPRDSYMLMTKYTFKGEGRHPDQTSTAFANSSTPSISTFFSCTACASRAMAGRCLKRLQDDFSEAKQKKVILSKGASVHGLPALRAFPGNRWLDIAMIRMNHQGSHMDTPEMTDVKMPGNVEECGGPREEGEVARYRNHQHETGGRRLVHKCGRPSGFAQLCFLESPGFTRSPSAIRIRQKSTKRSTG